MAIGDRIKQVRECFGLTQEEFGERIELGRSHISLLESGKRSPSDLSISNICRVYGVNRDWLVKGTGEMFGGTQALIEGIVRLLDIADEEDREWITAYLQLPTEKRRAFRDFLDGFVESVASKKK